MITLFIMCMVNSISENETYGNSDRAVTCEEFGAFISEP